MKKNLTLSVLSFLLLAAVFISYLNKTGIEGFELKFYDMATSLRDKSDARNIILIAIDEESVAKMGRWPWSRDKIAALLSYLNSPSSKPAVIGLNILFSEPENDKTAKLIEEIRNIYVKALSDKEIKELKKESSLMSFLQKAELDNDNDSKLALSLSSSVPAVLPMFFNIEEINGKVKEEPASFKKMAATVSGNSAPDRDPIEASSFILPIETLISSGSAVGHANVFNDQDGAVRKHYPFIFYNNSAYPSFPLAVALTYSSSTAQDIILRTGENFSLGKKQIPLDYDGSFYVAYANPKKFRTVSFYDAINDKVAPETFKDKIVLIGLTAQGLGSFYVTPTAKNMSNLEYAANSLENILNGNYIQIPQWAPMAEVSSILIIGLFSIFILPRLKAGTAALISASIFSALLLFSGYMLSAKGEWIRMTYPSFLLAASYMLVITRKFFFTEKKKELIEESAIETNKLLGLSFQGQGMLDLAFEKFQLCPVNDQMKGLLYNLGLDFERKRQFNKAQAVYEYISEKDPKYKDLSQKIESMKKASQGGLISTPGKAKEGTILVEGASAVPTLGRYEITKELGKGAMGIVYLGKDPKINRTVAIKTMRFEEGMDEKEMKTLKERFFREAQAAGNLSHPNIVKIFDAGEDQDIAYMAMELLKGEDLKKYASPQSLLPKEKVLEYMKLAADALDYAHKNGVIHRDIKPANIMLLEDGTLRVTDFGIARIQESSKTATGTVMGTPYYMSPEQIAGKKVDGRADIFSLGVTMYELLTGERPWKGGESVATLFYQITNENFEKPSVLKKEISEEVDKVIEKALKKNPQERYQTAGEMARDIEKILKGEKIAENTNNSAEKKDSHAAVEIKQEPKNISENLLTKPQTKEAQNKDKAQNPAPGNIKSEKQIPISETLGQKKQSAENAGADIEKTLPLIYPEDERGNK
ncbi:MAG: CHASE2 domain-containing protein [Elusimicrobia bacterium]|nr:CHASE2 domain-containing protein [Elusimicrobiota bacterium]